MEVSLSVSLSMSFPLCSFDFQINVSLENKVAFCLDTKLYQRKKYTKLNPVCSEKKSNHPDSNKVREEVKTVIISDVLRRGRFMGQHCATVSRTADCNTSNPLGCWSMSQLLSFCSSSVLMAGESSREWLKCLGPTSHTGDPEEALGFGDHPGMPAL